MSRWRSSRSSRRTDLSQVTIQVARNFIHDDYYGVFTIGAASVTGVNTNVFHNVTSITGYSAAF